MHLRNIDLNLLTVFDAIMSEGNMTRAAQTLGMTQPAVSLAVSRLRDLIGDPLFERSGRSIKPTPRALAMAAPVRNALENLNGAIESGISFDPMTSTRTFNLVLSDMGEMLYLPQLMQTLAAQKAGVTIRTHTAEGLDALRDLRFGAIDLLYWLEPLEDPEITVKQLRSEPQVCLLRKDHPLAAKPLSLEDYVGLDHLAIRLPLFNSHTVVSQRIRASGHQRRIALEVHSCHEMPPVLTKTDLVATLPVSMAEHMAHHFELAVVEAPLAEMTLPSYLMWHRTMDNDSGHMWMRDLLMAMVNNS